MCIINYLSSLPWEMKWGLMIVNIMTLFWTLTITKEREFKASLIITQKRGNKKQLISYQIWIVFTSDQLCHRASLLISLKCQSNRYLTWIHCNTKQFAKQQQYGGVLLLISGYISRNLTKMSTMIPENEVGWREGAQAISVFALACQFFLICGGVPMSIYLYLFICEFEKNAGDKPHSKIE